MCVCVCIYIYIFIYLFIYLFITWLRLVALQWCSDLLRTTSEQGIIQR